MARFEIQGPDGKTYEIEASSMEEAASALESFATPKGGSSVNKPAVDDFGARLTTLAANASNSMAFGMGDEAMGAKEGIKSLLSGGDYLPAYRKERDAVRSDMSTIGERYPAAATTGSIGGSAIPAIVSAPLATGKTMLQTGLRSMGIGAAEGAAHGAGNADGKDMLGQTIRGGLIGGGLGLAAPALVGGLGMLKNGVKDPLTGILGIASKGKANRAITGAMDRAGVAGPDLDALLAAAKSAGQPEFTIMDALGLPGQRLANGLTRAGGAPGDEVADFLMTRQAGQPERVGAFVEDAFGVKGTTAAKTKEGLTASRKSTADAAYDAARGNAAPVDVRSALGVIDARIGGMKGSGIAGDAIDSKLAGYRARLAGDGKGLGEGVTGAELSDFDRVLGVKQAIQDDIGAAVRAGRNNEARELGKLVAELDSALEASSDMYRTANDGFRAASKVIDAVDEGALMATRGRAADNVPRFGAMAAAERDAARTGYGDRLLEQLEKIAAPTSNRAKPLLSPKRAAEASAMAIDPKLYADRLARESKMWETQNRALGGSRTADNLADQEAMTGLAGGAMEALKSAGNMNFGDTVAKIISALGRAGKGQNEQTRALIAKALLSSDVTALAPAIAQSASSAKIRRILEGFTRQAGREISE